MRWFVLPILAVGISLASAAEKSVQPEPLPLPFHTLEGYGGGAITAMAYTVNPGQPKNVFGLPSVAATYINLGQKNLQALTFTETLFGRFEIGFGVDRLDLGRLDEDIQKATGVDVKRDDVWLYNVNARLMFVDENSFNCDWMPAITAGVHFKYNDGVDSIDRRLGGALTKLGYERQYGEEFTLVATKMFPKFFGRPLIVSAGLRVSSAAQIGFLGFSDHWSVTVEANVVYIPTDWLLLAYEFRQKNNPYDTIPGLVGDEDNWHAFHVCWIINSHSTLVAGYGILGELVNADANCAWWVQYKWEF